MKRAALLAVGFLLCGAATFAQGVPVAAVEVSLCDVAKDPKAFDGKSMRVRGTFHVSFESFTIFARGCEAKSAVWVAFGGDVPRIVTSMANDNVRRSGVDMTVNGTPYGTKKDDNFRKLYALLAARSGEDALYRVTATLTGVFLSGDEQKGGDGKTYFAGYGHLGCCSLLVIQEVGGVSSVPSATLEAHGVVLDPKGKPLGGFTVFDDVLGGLPPQRQESVTDEHGRFRFTNSGQLLRFEDPKYRPVALPIEPGGAPVRVQLEDAKKSDWLVRDCGSAAESSNKVGFTVLFNLPKTMTSELINNEDQHTYFVYPTGGESVKANFSLQGDRRCGGQRMSSSNPAGSGSDGSEIPRGK